MAGRPRLSHFSRCHSNQKKNLNPECCTILYRVSKKKEGLNEALGAFKSFVCLTILSGTLIKESKVCLGDVFVSIQCTLHSLQAFQ